MLPRGMQRWTRSQATAWLIECNLAAVSYPASSVGMGFPLRVRRFLQKCRWSFGESVSQFSRGVFLLGISGLIVAAA